VLFSAPDDHHTVVLGNGVAWIEKMRGQDMFAIEREALSALMQSQAH
jgi:hypothetical protein